MASARHQHLVDDMDHAIRLHDIADRDEGMPALGVDDLKPTALTTAMTLMGANGAQRMMIPKVSPLAGTMRRIESTGICNGVKHKITVIAPAGSTENPQATSSVLGWSEQ